MKMSLTSQHRTPLDQLASVLPCFTFWKEQILPHYTRAQCARQSQGAGEHYIHISVNLPVGKAIVKLHENEEKKKKEKKNERQRHRTPQQDNVGAQSNTYTNKTKQTESTRRRNAQTT